MSDTTPSRREPLITVEAVAAQLGVHPRSVRNYISKGLFPAYRIPGTRGVRLKLSEVNAALRLIPATTARAGVGSFGPNAKIIDLPRRIEAYNPEADA